VEALVRLQRTPAALGQVFNVGGTEEVSIAELARLVIKSIGSSSAIERVPYSEAYPLGFEDMRRRRPVVDKLEKFTGFRPATPLRRIIEFTAELS
jgi:UDP-glucose 4-epimerase